LRKTIDSSELVYDIRHINKHLPGTTQSEKLIRKEGAAHVFNDKETLEYVEKTILEEGKYIGNVRGAERYGYQFKEPIGYRIDANGNRIPLHYGEMKVSAGKYHIIPRTRPSK
jgi:uncharacterized protein (UPF0216 family)